MKNFVNHHRGFTLIELLVTITIVGILAAIAFNAFIHYKDQAHIAAGRMVQNELFTAGQALFNKIIENDSGAPLPRFQAWTFGSGHPLTVGVDTEGV